MFIFENVCPQRTCTHLILSLCMPGDSTLRRDSLFNATPNVQKAMAQNVAVTLNIVSKTQKK